MVNSVNFNDMTDAQKQEAFQKWVTSRENRKGTNAAKRNAIKALISAHQDEYDGLLKGTAPASARPVRT